MELSFFQNMSFLLLVLAAILILVAISMVFLTFTWRKRLYEKNLILDRIKAEKEKEIAESMFAAQEKEREQIAEDLHDEIGSILSLLKINLSKKNHDYGNVDDNASLQSEIELMDMVISRIRSITGTLTPSSLLRHGLVNAFEVYCAQLDATGKMEVTCQTVNERENDPELKTTLNIYKIFLELMHNLLKHSGAEKTEVHTILTDEYFRLLIKHNGIGLEQTQFESLKNNSNGIGLKSISTRVSIENGTLNFAKNNNLFIIDLYIPFV